MARVVVPGVAHHVTQRGNRRERVFRRKADYARYLSLLSEYAADRGLAIHAYCLMANHLHLIAVPRETGSLAGTLKPVHLRYAQEFNRRLGVGGVLWQGRFHSCPMDADHYWTAVHYVERNPVRAGLVRGAEEYAWSSAAAHCGLRADELLSPMAPPAWLVNLPPVEVQKGWALWLGGKEDEEERHRLRLCTRTGRPAGGGRTSWTVWRTSSAAPHAPASPAGRESGRNPVSVPSFPSFPQFPSFPRKPQCRPSRQRLLDGEKEAKLVAICCSKVPAGHTRWTLTMLADELVRLEIVEGISRETVRKVLKKTT